MPWVKRTLFLILFISYLNLFVFSHLQDDKELKINKIKGNQKLNRGREQTKINIENNSTVFILIGSRVSNSLDKKY